MKLFTIWANEIENFISVCKYEGEPAVLLGQEEDDSDIATNIPIYLSRYSFHEWDDTTNYCEIKHGEVFKNSLGEHILVEVWRTPQKETKCVLIIKEAKEKVEGVEKLAYGLKYYSDGKGRKQYLAIAEKGKIFTIDDQFYIFDGENIKYSKNKERIAKYLIGHE